MKNTIVILGVMIGSMGVFATTSMAHNGTELFCVGDSAKLAVYESGRNGQLIAEVFVNGRLAISKEVRQSVSYSSKLKMATYRGGSVLRGGVNIRIRKSGSSRGYGHVTFKYRGKTYNDLVDCY
jgi:hypothetical protein